MPEVGLRLGGLVVRLQTPVGVPLTVRPTALPEIAAPVESVTVTVITEVVGGLVTTAGRVDGVAITVTKAAVCLIAAPVALVLAVLAS